MTSHLTIDATIQYYCERILEEGIQKFEVRTAALPSPWTPRPGPSWPGPTRPPMT